MPLQRLKTLAVRNRKQWRNWLRAHHDCETDVWLVFPKRHTAEPCLSYDDAVEEAICYGWIDSLIKRLDDDRYVRKFTPRKPDSRWSTINRRRYARLKSLGLLQPAGLERPPTNRNGDAPRPSKLVLPANFEVELKASPRAWEFFQQLTPSCRRAYLGWIGSAKREETKQKRLREAIARLAAGEKLGLK